MHLAVRMGGGRLIGDLSFLVNTIENSHFHTQTCIIILSKCFPCLHLSILKTGLSNSLSACYKVTCLQSPWQKWKLNTVIPVSLLLKYIHTKDVDLSIVVLELQCSLGSVWSRTPVCCKLFSRSVCSVCSALQLLRTNLSAAVESVIGSLTFFFLVQGAADLIGEACLKRSLSSISSIRGKSTVVPLFPPIIMEEESFRWGVVWRNGMLHS